MPIERKIHCSGISPAKWEFFTIFQLIFHAVFEAIRFSIVYREIERYYYCLFNIGITLNNKQCKDKINTLKN